MLQKNCSNLHITKVWKLLQHVGVLSSSLLLLLSLEDTYSRELVQSLLSSKGGHCAHQHWRDESTAATFSCLSYTCAEQKSHQHTGPNTGAWLSLLLQWPLAHIGSRQPGHSWSILEASTVWYEHGLRDEKWALALLLTNEEVPHQLMHCKSFLQPLGINAAMKLLQ